MRMPYPYIKKNYKVEIFKHFGPVSIPVYLIPEAEILGPGELLILTDFAEKIADAHKAKIKQALDKIQDNHLREHLRVSLDHCSVEFFRNSLELQSVSLWADGSWAMVFRAQTDILSNRDVCVSFPADRPAFTAIP